MTGGTRVSAADFFAIAKKLLDHRNGLRAFLFCYVMIHHDVLLTAKLRYSYNDK